MNAKQNNWIKLLIMVLVLLLNEYGQAGQMSASPNPVYFFETGNYYEAISIPEGINWDDARAMAQSLSYLGQTGYLATITSASENDFIINNLGGPLTLDLYWLGGFQPPGSPEPGGNWQWVTGESWGYNNWCGRDPNDWCGSEPNNGYGGESGGAAGSSEEVLHFWCRSGRWNDMEQRALQPGFIVEYGHERLGDLVSLEIVGPNAVAQGSQVQYQAIAHHEMADMDVTDSVVWSIENETVASIEAGLLTIEPITIRAEYTVTKVAEKQVSLFTTCPGGTALEFDGVDDYVNCGNDTSLDIISEITIAAWIRPTRLSDEVVLLNKGNGCGNYTLYIRDGELALLSSDRCHWNNRGTQSNIAIDLWQHIVVTCNSDSIGYYVNGLLTDIVKADGVGAHNKRDLNIGGTTVLGWPLTRFFHGTIDEVAIFNRVLNREEIWGLMHCRPVMNDPYLIAYWDFEEGQGETAGDSSGNGNDGTIVGANWVKSSAPVGKCVPLP